MEKTDINFPVVLWLNQRSVIQCSLEPRPPITAFFTAAKKAEGRPGYEAKYNVCQLEREKNPTGI